MTIKLPSGSTLTLIGFIVGGCLFSALTSFLMITFSHPLPHNVNYLELVIDNEDPRDHVLSKLHEAGYLRLKQKQQDQQETGSTSSSRQLSSSSVDTKEVAFPKPAPGDDASSHQTGMVNPVLTHHIFYLHIPKAGTSFFNTLYLHFCPKVLKDHPELLDQNRALMYEERKYGFGDACFDEQTNIQTVFYNQHRNPVFHWPLNIDKNLPTTIVAMFRDPYLRARSAFMYTSHDDMRPMHAKDPDMTFEEYVKMPEIQGCQVAMVAGNKKCEAPRKHKVKIEKALDIIEKPNFFFGITDRWDESICLFHKWFGGEVQNYELKNNRKTIVNQRHKKYHHMLENVTREMYPMDMDMIWFQKVEKVFDDRLKEAGCFGKQYNPALLAYASSRKGKN